MNHTGSLSWRCLAARKLQLAAREEFQRLDWHDTEVRTRCLVLLFGPLLDLIPRSMVTASPDKMPVSVNAPSCCLCRLDMDYEWRLLLLEGATSPDSRGAWKALSSCLEGCGHSPDICAPLRHWHNVRLALHTQRTAPLSIDKSCKSRPLSMPIRSYRIDSVKPRRWCVCRCKGNRASE